MMKQATDHQNQMPDQHRNTPLSVPLRLLIIGNSGSGKSTMSQRIGAARDLPTFDLDDAFWQADGQGRERKDAITAVADFTRYSEWIVEGVYEFLIEIALSRATELIWLKLSWEECREALLQRGYHHGMDPNDPDALNEWAQAHQERLEKQTQLYDRFHGRKLCLQSRCETDGFAEAHHLP